MIIIWMHYYMQYKDFTLNPYNFPTNQVKDFVTKLHNNGLQYGKILEGNSVLEWMIEGDQP